MATRFVIAVEAPTAIQSTALTEWLATLGGYWHWMRDVWMFSSSQQTDVVALQAGIAQILAERAPTKGLFSSERMPVPTFLVVEIGSHTTWFVSSPQGANDWLVNHFGGTPLNPMQLLPPR